MCRVSLTRNLDILISGQVWTKADLKQWCFMSGHESQEYMDEPSNHAVYDVNTIANYDPEIIPFLNAPIGSAFERNEVGLLIEINE